jgi:(p)ppGpp synthase/HD superfamily hydrolase
VEDCAVDVEQLSETFGARVSELVLEVTNEKKEPGLTREMRKRLDRERLAKVSQDAKLIKMIDRIDNLLDLAGAEPEFKIQYAQESDLLMAEALGINGDGRSWVFSVLRVEYITTLNTVLAKAKEELINRTVKG